ncbi:60S acidic ribosomal protein P1 [Rhizophlyctis rosea]|nr:60S acidic ribosomal protein P1 [Rhizophlyctis rosea]
MSLSTSEAACVYAALILHDDGVEITADKLSSLISAAGVEVEPIWPNLFAKALEGKDIGSFLFNVGSGSGPAPAGGAAPAAGGAAPAEEAKEEKKKEEVKEESDDDMGFGLFD